MSKMGIKGKVYSKQLSTQKLNQSPNRTQNMSQKRNKKSRIRETKHLSTDAVDAIGGWTKNTPKPNFFEKLKNSSKMQKHLEICQN